MPCLNAKPLTVRATALTAALALAALSLPASPAEAGHRHRHHGYYDGPIVVERHVHHHRRGGDDAVGVAIAAGIVGLALGAIIIGATQPPAHHRPAPVYAPQPYPYDEGNFVVSEPRPLTAAPEPYTAEWYRYCAGKFRSFDAASGTYMTYSGVRKLCQ